MAEWLCTGLQIRGGRFDSGLRLHFHPLGVDQGGFLLVPLGEP